MKTWLMRGVIVVGLGLLYAGWQYLSITSYGEKVKPVKSDVIIVPGAEVRGEEPSPALAERCEWAYSLYREGYANKLILSGARGSGLISEAEAMKRYLMKLGVPEEAMLLEEKSTSTRENLLYSKAIMEQHGMKTAIVATHRFHQKRVQVLSKQLEMNTTGYGEKSKWLYEPYWVLRETAAIVKVYLGT
jgi:uncharacterized SAM-binding protein YcdF (DUF218 family)